MPKISIREGLLDKGGQDIGPSGVKIRPPPPTPTKTCDDFGRWNCQKGKYERGFKT